MLETVLFAEEIGKLLRSWRAIKPAANTQPLPHSETIPNTTEKSLEETLAKFWNRKPDGTSGAPQGCELPALHAHIKDPGQQP